MKKILALLIVLTATQANAQSLQFIDTPYGRLTVVDYGSAVALYDKNNRLVALQQKQQPAYTSPLPPSFSGAMNSLTAPMNSFKHPNGF